jgi:amino acid transporter
MSGMNHHQNPESGLERVIGVAGYGAISINSVIGAGIFGLPAAAAAMTGAFSPWLFVLAGVMIVTVVLAFAQAASVFQQTGGVIVYARHAFGDFVGFQTGWLAYLARMAAVGANTNLLVTYASWFWAPLDTQPYQSIALSAIILALTWLNATGVRNSIGLMFVFTVLKLLPLSLLILFGLGHIDLQMLAGAEIPAVGDLGEALLVVMYAYVGFEGTVVTAGEGRDPRRDLPRALLHTILAIGVIYVLVQTVSMSVLPGIAESETAVADAAGVLFGPAGAAIMTLGAVFSIGGNLHSSMLSAPRMSFALARDGSMPAWFAKVHPRFHTPHTSIWFYGIFGLALALTGSFIWLAIISTLVRLLTYMVCIAALPRIMRSAESHADLFRLPGGMLIPALALLLCLWLTAQASLDAWLMTGAFFALGSVLYYLAPGATRAEAGHD